MTRTSDDASHLTAPQKHRRKRDACNNHIPNRNSTQSEGSIMWDWFKSLFAFRRRHSPDAELLNTFYRMRPEDEARKAGLL